MNKSAIRDNRVRRETRWLGVFVLPFLLAAAVILLIFPTETQGLFAWPIQPALTARMLGAAYLGGMYFFFRVVAARQWHTIRAGFPPVTAFTTLLGIATLLHWDRFTHNHISFIAWAGLYFTTPFLVLAAWLANRRADPGAPAPENDPLPPAARWFLGGVGLSETLVGLLLFFAPAIWIPGWPWALTPLTTRVVGALTTLAGVTDLTVALDGRWSAARIPLQAQAFSLAVILVSALLAREEIHFSSPATWFFFIGLGALLAGIVALFITMERTGKR